MSTKDNFDKEIEEQMQAILQSVPRGYESDVRKWFRDGNTKRLTELLQGAAIHRSTGWPLNEPSLERFKDWIDFLRCYGGGPAVASRLRQKQQLARKKRPVRKRIIEEART